MKTCPYITSTTILRTGHGNRICRVWGFSFFGTTLSSTISWVAVPSEMLLSRQVCHRHEPAALSLYNWNTTTSHYISDHKN